MYKKYVALLAILMSTNPSCFAFGQEASQGYQASSGYPASQGYQTDSKHHNHHHHSEMSYDDRKAIEDYDKEIAAILKDGESPYLKSNICWIATAGGAVLLATGVSSGNGNQAILGGIIALAGGGIGMYTRSGEAEKDADREAKIKDRRDRQDKIRASYHRN